MKKFTTTLLLIVGVCSFANAEKTKHPLMASDTVVWTGLDYSMVRMIGTKNSQGQFSFQAPHITTANSPEQWNQIYFEQWNQLFLNERIEAVSDILNRQVIIDINGVSMRNKTATTNQIILQSSVGSDEIDKANITQQDIVAEVSSYKLDKTNGLGLVFIVEKLLLVRQLSTTQSPGSAAGQYNNSAAGIVHIVFFDVASREVISTERKVYHVSSGANFRNFWFGPIKNADCSLGKYRYQPPSSEKKFQSHQYRR